MKLLKRNFLLSLVCLTGAVGIAFGQSAVHGFSSATPDGDQMQVSDSSKREKLLDGILKLLPSDLTQNGSVSYRDKTFKDWLSRTGELPPDFDQMPSIPYLPDPLVLDEGGRNIPITNKQQWKQKRAWMKEALQHYITGTFPPAPDNLKADIQNEKKEGAVTIRTVVLTFGPDRRAKMTAMLMIPAGKGPFPVFMTQWNHKDWAMLAVRRGYIGCIYAGADMKDDTENYAEIWAGKYDFSRIMRRAYGAFRVVDYLYTLPIVNKQQIGITGHSRNGKQSLWAAAFDERIAAVIPSSGGSGGEVPWRYASHKYGCEDIALLSCAQPAWLHPRLRFFIGRENKLPVDQNLFMALVAPRGLMLSSSRRESDSNPWGIEQAYDTTLEVYQFLGAPDHLAIRLRDGRHGTSARDIEEYIDFFDYVFDRSDHKPPNELLYNYSFEQWKQWSGERIDPMEYPQLKGGQLLVDGAGQSINSINDWQQKRAAINRMIQWALGITPPGTINTGPLDFKTSKNLGESYYGNMIPRLEPTSTMGRVTVAPGHSKPGFGDYLYGYLYYPKAQEEQIKKGQIKLPVIIFLHKYNYSNGFYDTQGFDHRKSDFVTALVKQGYAVFFYDMMGFGNRIEEGTRFYERYPHWSKMGKFVTDLRGAVDALAHLNFIDSSAISVMGYALGATVGLYGAALDQRIARVVSVCGFTPMRTDTPDKGTEGIKAYSHLRGLLPRLGFFVGQEDRLPYDFDGILASIAPRPLLVVSPVLDEDATLGDVKRTVQRAGEVYALYGQPDHLEEYSPYDYSRFSADMQKKVLQWLQKTGKHSAGAQDMGTDTTGGWESLFDGKQVTQWQSVKGDSFPTQAWDIKDGMLSAVGGGGPDLITRKTYRNFELTFAFKLTKGANSGIKYLVNKIKNNRTGKTGWNGPEYQIIDDYNHPAVKDHQHEEGSTASFYLIYPPQNKKLLPAGQWNNGKIIVNGHHVEHWLNGVRVVSCERGDADFRRRVADTKFKDYTDYGEAPSGHIMLTNHGDVVYFKAIKIKRLP